MRPLATILPLLSTMAWAAVAQAGGAEKDGRCWADWSTAAPVVHRESLRPAKDVRAQAQRKAPGQQLLNITLCEESGRYVYRLLFLRAGGTVETLTEDAKGAAGR